jgi:hypothetical protein
LTAGNQEIISGWRDISQDFDTTLQEDKKEFGMLLREINEMDITAPTASSRGDIGTLRFHDGCEECCRQGQPNSSGHGL